MAYKRPVSILVVIFAQDSGRVLMLQRALDDSDPAGGTILTSGSRLPAAWKRAKPRRRPPRAK